MIAVSKRLTDTCILAILRCVPARLMSHMMFLLHGRPDLTDRWGFHIRPIHYYEPLPDFRGITSEQLQRRRVSNAVDFKVPEQVALLQRLSDSYSREVTEHGASLPPGGFDFSNPYFSGLDAASYYALIRDLKPALVVEIGSGFSTQIASKAIARNAEGGTLARLVCIEPFPEARLTESGARFELVQKAVQDVPLTFFDQLRAGDILFIDSSHVATTLSDVCVELLEILPRLKPGVWVHVHDIFFPADYPSDWVLNRRLAFNEQYMLEAFMAFNGAYSVQLVNSWMWCEEREAALRLCPAYLGSVEAVVATPSSCWIKRMP